MTPVMQTRHAVLVTFLTQSVRDFFKLSPTARVSSSSRIMVDSENKMLLSLSFGLLVLNAIFMFQENNVYICVIVNQSSLSVTWEKEAGGSQQHRVKTFHINVRLARTWYYKTSIRAFEQAKLYQPTIYFYLRQKIWEDTEPKMEAKNSNISRLNIKIENVFPNFRTEKWYV